MSNAEIERANSELERLHKDRNADILALQKSTEEISKLREQMSKRMQEIERDFTGRIADWERKSKGFSVRINNTTQLIERAERNRDQKMKAFEEELKKKAANDNTLQTKKTSGGFW